MKQILEQHKLALDETNLSSLILRKHVVVPFYIRTALGHSWKMYCGVISINISRKPPC